MLQVLRYLWALPVTLLGLPLAMLALFKGGHLQIVDGVLEAHGPLLRWLLEKAVPLGGGALAITFGHIVLGRDAAVLDATRTHERVHVRQVERWGLFFVPAYLLSSLL
ncbi:MAG TPA: hypothetical protein VKP65_13310, partial [Rhodothermales bacterium]|nr:hypothetical protein [Rhodothermales bacterium]